MEHPETTIDENILVFLKLLVLKKGEITKNKSFHDFIDKDLTPFFKEYFKPSLPVVVKDLSDEVQISINKEAISSIADFLEKYIDDFKNDNLSPHSKRFLYLFEEHEKFFKFIFEKYGRKNPKQWRFSSSDIKDNIDDYNNKFGEKKEAQYFAPMEFFLHLEYENHIKISNLSIGDIYNSQASNWTITFKVDKPYDKKLPEKIKLTPESFDPNFDDEHGALKLKEQQLLFKNKTNHYYVLKALFSKSIGQMVTVRDVTNSSPIRPTSNRQRERSRSWVYDAIITINRKVKNKFGIKELIHCESTRIYYLVDNIETLKNL